MKVKSERDKRNIIIIALCAILVIMGVGYAAFSSMLNISGTANVTNSWCVGFDINKTNTYEVTKGLSVGTTPTGSMTYSGNVCETNYKTTATLSSYFYQPGDQIEYTLTIVNKSSITAAIKSIQVDSDPVTANTTKKKGNIIYTINMPEDTTLSPDEETTMTVIAKFQNDTPIESGYTGEEQSLTVGINVQQDDGNGGFTPTPAEQYVYAWNTTTVTVGTSKISDLASTKTAQPYYTSAADVMSASGYTLFNMYTVENDTITEEYSCQTFGISGFEPVCVKYSSDGSEYGYDAGGNHTGNAGILNALNSNTTFTGNNPAGSCRLGSRDSSCYAGRLYLNAYSDGRVHATDESAYAGCFVNNNGGAYCSGG